MQTKVNMTLSANDPVMYAANLTRSAAKLGLIIRLDHAIEGKADFTSMSIKTWVAGGSDYDLVFKMIAEQSTGGNQKQMSELLGADLVNDIIKFVSNEQGI